MSQDDIIIINKQYLTRSYYYQQTICHKIILLLATNKMSQDHIVISNEQANEHGD
jgi:hypothetical protein